MKIRVFTRLAQRLNILGRNLTAICQIRNKEFIAKKYSYEWYSAFPSGRAVLGGFPLHGRPATEIKILTEDLTVNKQLRRKRQILESEFLDFAS